jgi:hypothetical protein
MKRNLLIVVAVLLAGTFSHGQKKANRKADVPNIVVRFSTVNQSTSLPATTIFAPSVSGLFRVSAYLDYSPGILNSTTINPVNLRFSWTDDFGAQIRQNSNLSVLPVPDIAEQDLVLPLRLIAGQPLQVQVTLFGAIPTTFNLYVVVEDMNPRPSAHGQTPGGPSYHSQITPEGAPSKLCLGGVVHGWPSTMTSLLSSAEISRAAPSTASVGQRGRVAHSFAPLRMSGDCLA